MLTLNDLHCPICGRDMTAKGNNGLYLCSIHGWLRPYAAIRMPQAAPVKVTARG